MNVYIYIGLPDTCSIYLSNIPIKIYKIFRYSHTYTHIHTYTHTHTHIHTTSIPRGYH